MVACTRSLRWWVLCLWCGGQCVAPSLAKDKAPDKVQPKSMKEFRELEKMLDADEDEPVSSPADRYQTSVETPLIGQYTNFAGLQPIEVVGFGLVVGLSGTGGNPAPSPMRTALLEDLKRRNIRNPNQILQSPDTALVVVRTLMPPLLEKGETIDVEVFIPESAEATSLQGGWLMETYLTEQALVPGKGTLAGHQYARAKGPILTAVVSKTQEKDHPKLRRGRVLGGGTVLRERELSMYLRSDFRSIRNAIRISDAISRRFHDYDQHGIQKPMAVPKNDQKIVLDVHPLYKNNFPRYLQVIRHIAFREQPTARRIRMQRLKAELLTPETSEEAALQLEGIGKDAIPLLKAGLLSPLLECRFQAACALAYLGEPDGVTVLAETVRDERAFRVYALAALSVIDDADAHLALRKLTNDSSMETRYGAFRALWVLNKNDPFIRGEPIKVMEGKTGYMLHELDTPGEALVHLSTRTRPEVVLFGADQSFHVPLYLTAGRNIMVTAQPGAQTASVVRFTPDRPDERREVSLKVADVIRAVSELDGTYPDVVQMLTEAATQNNLTGRFAYDALPEAGRMYERPAPLDGLAAKGSRKTRVGRDNLTPNLFPLDPSKEDESSDHSEPAEPSPAGMLNVPAKTASTEQPETASREAPDKVKSSSAAKPGTRKKTGNTAENSRPSRWPSWLTPRVHRFEGASQEPARAPLPVKSKTSEQSEPEVQTEP